MSIFNIFKKPNPQNTRQEGPTQPHAVARHNIRVNFDNRNGNPIYADRQTLGSEYYKGGIIADARSLRQEQACNACPTMARAVSNASRTAKAGWRGREEEREGLELMGRLTSAGRADGSCIINYPNGGRPQAHVVVSGIEIGRETIGKPARTSGPCGAGEEIRNVGEEIIRQQQQQQEREQRRGIFGIFRRKER